MSRNPIQDHFVILCSKLNVEKVLPYLKQERMVTTDEYEMLTSPNFTTRQKRAEKLLKLLPRKGRNYFTNFGKCLVWSGQTELARHIGVDVALVPEPPFQLPEEEPSPAEQQQQIVNILRGIMSSGQPPPAYSPSSAPQHNYAPQPAQPLVNGGAGVPVPLSKAHQPSTNTGVHFLLPGSGNNQAVHTVPPPAQSPAEPMDLSGPVVPQHMRPDRNVLRASTANQEPAAVPQPQRKGKVFILYCKDGLPQDFSDEVLDLADTLTSCGGFKCEVDHYIDVPPPNWNTWTIQQIQESEYVILVYSPILDQQIHSTQNIMLNMEKGKYYANGIINLMHPPKFIPVYLNGRLPPNNLGWLPPQLHTCTEYKLNINQLRMAIEVPEGTPEHIFSGKLTEALHEDRFRDVAKLVSHLRGESDTTRPNPPLNPIKVPAVHNPPPQISPSQMPASSDFDHVQTKMPSRVAHPQSQVHQDIQFKSGDLREMHVHHPQTDPHKSYNPPPPGPVASSQQQQQQQQVHEPSHPQSGIQREPHVAHIESEVHQVLNGTHPQIAMQHSGIHSGDVIQSYNHDTGEAIPAQALMSFEQHDIRDHNMRKIGLVVKGEWFRLGEVLGVQQQKLNNIKQSLGVHPDYSMAGLNMLNAWRAEKKELATREALKQALCRLNYEQLAQGLFTDE